MLPDQRTETGIQLEGEVQVGLWRILNFRQAKGFRLLISTDIHKKPWSAS